MLAADERTQADAVYCVFGRAAVPLLLDAAQGLELELAQVVVRRASQSQCS